MSIGDALLAAALSLTLASPGVADATDPIHYTIEAPQLSAALIQLSQQSGISIVFADQVVRDLPAPEVVGTIKTSEALDALLLGTDLGWKLVDSNCRA